MNHLEILEQFLVDRLLPEPAQAQFRQGNIANQALVPFVECIKRLSEAYTGHVAGARLTQPVASIGDAEAYALYYTLINAAKIQALTAMVPLPDVPSVLDLGCGPGTAFLALLAARTESYNFTGVETSSAMSSVALRLVQAWTATERVRSVNIVRTLDSVSTQCFDLVIAANVLAETSEDMARELVNRLVERVAPGGSLILMEPGQQLHTRRLMSLRNVVLGSFPELTPIFPCTRRDSCPMIAQSESDWCHGMIPWTRPRLISQLDALLGFNKHRIKYSGFVFTRGAQEISGYRVVSSPEKSTAGVTVMLCGPDYYGLVRIRKGERSSNNRPLEKADVFERILFSRPLSADIDSDTVATVA